MAEMRVSITHTRSARDSMNYLVGGSTKKTWPCLSLRSIPPMGDWGQILWVGNRLEAGNISRKITLGLKEIIHKKYLGVKKIIRFWWVSTQEWWDSEWEFSGFELGWSVDYSSKQEELTVKGKFWGVFFCLIMIISMTDNEHAIPMQTERTDKTR